MTVLHCLADTDAAPGRVESLLWIIELVFVALYFFTFFLLSAFAMIKYRLEFRLLPGITKTTRICLTVTLFLKAMGHVICIIVGRFADRRSADGDRSMHISGLLCLEFPAYLISSCYTLVVMNWLSSCVQIFPYKYVKVYRRIKMALTSYNTFIYVLFVSDVIVAFLEMFTTPEFRSYYVSGTVILRDFVLFVIFLVFIISVKIMQARENYRETDAAEKNLFMYTISLTLCVLIRCAFSVIHGLKYRNTPAECQVSFFTWRAINEIVIEGLALALLIHGNNKHLMRQRSTTYELNPAQLGTGDEY